MSIAFFSVIENARGTNVVTSLPGYVLREGDVLIGNAWDNVLYGEDGDDHLYGDGLVYDGDAGFLGIDEDLGVDADGDGDATNDFVDPQRAWGAGNEKYADNLSGDDELYGGSGDDWLYGGLGNNILHGGSGFEIIDYDLAHDVLTDNLGDNDIEVLIEAVNKASGDYTVTRTIHDGNGGSITETDTLQRIERIAHAEKQIEKVGSSYYKEMSVAEITGGYVAVFLSYASSGKYFVKFQRFDIHGEPLGNPSNVSNINSAQEYKPSVTSTDDGGFAVLWHEQVSSLNKTLMRKFSSTGTPSFDEVEVFENPDTGNFIVDYGSKTSETIQDVAELSNGDIAVVAYASGNTYAPLVFDAYDVIVQIVDGTTGDLIGEKSIVNSTTADYQTDPKVVGLTNGDFVVAWYSQTSSSATEGIYFQRYELDNGEYVQVGSETRVSQNLSGTQDRPEIAALADGGFVITWTDSNHSSGHATDVFFSRYDASGSIVSGQQEVMVNTNTSNGQSNSNVSALDDGGFIITYTDHNPVTGGSGSIIMAQQYDDTGTTRGDNFMVNVTTTNTSNGTSVTSIDNGDFVVGWADSTYGMMNRVYSISDSDLVA